MVPWQISGSYLEACNCEALVDVVVSARGRDASAGGQRRGNRRARSHRETPPAQADGNGRQISTTAPPLPYKLTAKVPYPAEPATPIVGADPAVVNSPPTKPPVGPKKPVKHKPRPIVKTHPTVPRVNRHTPRQPVAFHPPAKPAPKKHR